MHWTCTKAHGFQASQTQERFSGEETFRWQRCWGIKEITDGMIDKLQNYYDQALRNNLHSLQDMRSAVWATYFHELSTDDHPQHDLCPKGDNSWCKYNRKVPHYKHHGLPESVMLAIKPI